MKPNGIYALAETYLTELYPDAACGLDYDHNGYRLLTAAILSAQCTDKRVNEVCVTLFSRWPDAASLAAADVEDIAAVIRSVGLYNAKARNLKECCSMLVSIHGGTVPSDMDSLLALPGVGRKIANLIRGDLYGLGGIVADTHMIRFCNRLGFTDKPDPLTTERTMQEIIPLRSQSDFCHKAVLFGRDICRARQPRCGMCRLSEVCRYHSDIETENGT